MIRIAIVGAGFSGLATAWNFLHDQDNGLPLEIVIFDSADLGKNSSGISAGLLHPYASPRAKLVSKGVEGQAATLELIKVASNALGIPVAEKTGQFRSALTTRQKKDFFQCASIHDDVHWHDVAAYEPGIFIESSYLVNTKKYLLGLWKSCEAKGVLWKKQKIESLAELKDFDLLIVTAGYAVISFSELSFLPIKPVKGQILEIEWPAGLPPLPFPINSGVYLIMDASSRCIVGATFEHTFFTEEPDLGVAQGLLQKK